MIKTLTILDQSLGKNTKFAIQTGEKQLQRDRTKTDRNSYKWTIENYSGNKYLFILGIEN